MRHVCRVTASLERRPAPLSHCVVAPDPRADHVSTGHNSLMASFGHVAVGLLAGRLHGGAFKAQAGGAPPSSNGRSAWTLRFCSAPTLLAFALIATIPDVDLAFVALGAPDDGVLGHRGASHSFGTALIVGLACATLARRVGWPVVRTAVVAAIAVASHPLLDLLGDSGRALPLFWPFSMARFESPIRIFPDSPRGTEIFSLAGIGEVAIELLMFAPVTAFALWPGRSEDSARSWWTWRRRVPTLMVIEGGASSAAPGVPGTAPGTESVVVVTDEPPLRSSG